MDILNRLGINNRTTRRSKFAEFYNLKKDIKSNSVAIENSIISNSINDLISYKVSPRGEDGDEKKGFLRKTKDGISNIINKIITFLKRVKDYIVKKFKQFKEFIFGKKADKVEKVAKAATTIINEVIKKDGVVPTDVPNNAWDYFEKQYSDNDLKEAFGYKGSIKVETIDLPKTLLLDHPNILLEEDITDELSTVLQYLSMLRYDEFLKNGSLGNLPRGINIDEFGKDQLKDLSQAVGPAYAKVLGEFSTNYLIFTKHAVIESISVSEKDKLKKAIKTLEEMVDNTNAIKKIFSEINIKLVKYYDDTMKKVESLKKELNGDANFNELYRDITDMNGVLIQNNDKLLKEADQLLKVYAELIDKINIKIK